MIYKKERKGQMPNRRIYLLFLYTCSITLSSLLFLWSGIYCQFYHCIIDKSDNPQPRGFSNLFSKEDLITSDSENIVEYVPTLSLIISVLLLVSSLIWFVNNTVYKATEFMRDYNCLEMPTAVFSSLLSGVCAVVEIHYTYHDQSTYWGEKWSFPATAASLLLFIHAAIVFALT
uniref:Transmembrane protein n=1 Tax=Parastrongyloides trichosuri TaxID=131310 RepID=A0A0N4ZHI1_PARTI